MSFQHKSLWLPRDAGCLTDGDIGYDNSSRIEPKRAHQWFMDTPGPELFSNKKQAIETVHNRPVAGISPMNVSPWHNSSSFQSISGQFTDRLFGSEPLRTVNVVDRNIPSVNSGNVNTGRKDFDDQYGNTSVMGLSMSHTIEDPGSCISFGGIRKVKVNEVRDSEDGISASLEHSYGRGDNHTVSMGTTYSKSDNNAISLGSTFNNGDQNTISIGPTFSKADGNFVSMGQTADKGNDKFISMSHLYNKGNENILSMGQPFNKGEGSFISMGPSYNKGDSNVISMAPSYSKGHDNFISMAPSYAEADENFISMGPKYNKADENFISMAPAYSKGDDNVISMGPSYEKADSNLASMGPNQDKRESNVFSMGHNYNKSSNISFGGFHDEPETNPGGIISGYDLLGIHQNSTHPSEMTGQKVLAESNVDPIVISVTTADTIPKNKEPKISKKAPPNNFPSNVKSLLSTGMLDGVPVKYVSWSREKNLQGTIKGTGYLCGCDDCKFSKALNAYEFERHAKCKTKHPNNHIYFENGKTIYAVVQELKNTPQEMLFDAIQSVTGSPINQKNFRAWKASYLAATRELQRIYGRDEVALPS
ncbi:hypothetical protein CFOL_v3_19541 [Cephalotus follicularis]|uniref:Tify domain-containing protein n=1 Tax=Cephalotus follicularis TaxID=3775 RepID=A0A1Q3C701_CEPFO|nr:hypothetical protein CFOL_v3_19541 [Cephalotus follicularis]